MAESAKTKALHSFELDRSKNAAIAANDNSRPMAQAALLINGAAATAIIAFLTKDKIEPVMLRIIPWSLAFYAAGVAFGALTMFLITEALDFWNCFWELKARGASREEIREQEVSGNRWWWAVRACFFLSIMAFVLGSSVMAYAILNLPLQAPALCGPS